MKLAELVNLSVEASYRHRLYHRYVSTHFGSIRPPSRATLERERQVWRSYFRSFLPKDRGARILDLGCGYGSFLYFLRKEGYENAVGVDVSPEQVETARRLGIDNVERGDSREFLEKNAEGFDCITALDLIEHFPKEDVLPLLEVIHRALKPGAVFLLRSPNAGGPFPGKILYADFTHELAFTPSSVRQVLSATGFEEIAVYPEGPRVHGVLSAVRWSLWKAMSLFLLFYLVVETGGFGGHILTQNLIAAARKPLKPNPGGPQR